MNSILRGRHLPVSISPMLDAIRDGVRSRAENTSSAQQFSMVLPYAGEAVVRIPEGAMATSSLTGVVIEFLREPVDVTKQRERMPNLFSVRLCMSGAYIDEHPASDLELAVFRHEVSGQALPDWRAHALPALPEGGRLDELVSECEAATRDADPFSRIELPNYPGLVARSLGRSRDDSIPGHAFEAVLLVNQDDRPQMARITVSVCGVRNLDVRPISADLAQRHANAIHFDSRRPRVTEQDLDVAI